jgi:hypothetical protein
LFNKAREPGFHKMRLIDRLYEDFSQTDSENYKRYINYPKYPKWSKDIKDYERIVYNEANKEAIVMNGGVTNDLMMQIIRSLVKETVKEMEESKVKEEIQKINIFI